MKTGAFFVFFLPAFILGGIAAPKQSLGEAVLQHDFVITEPNFPTSWNGTSIDPSTNPATPALRGALDLHAENGDLDAQPSRRLGAAKLFLDIGKLAFNILDEHLGIESSFFSMLGLPTADDGPDLGKELEDINKKLDGLNHQLIMANEKLELLMIGQDRLSFIAAYRDTQKQIDYIRYEFGVMQDLLIGDNTPGVESAFLMFTTVQDYLINLGTSSAGRFGTLTMGIKYYSSNENDVSDLVQYWDDVEELRIIFKKWMYTGLVLLSYGAEMLNGTEYHNYTMASLEESCRTVAYSVKDMYTRNGVGFSHGKYLHVRDRLTVLARLGSKHCGEQGYEDDWKGLQNRFQFNDTCIASYSSRFCDDPASYRYELDIKDIVDLVKDRDFHVTRVVRERYKMEYKIVTPFYIRYSHATAVRCTGSKNNCSRLSGMGNIYDELYVARDAYQSYPGVKETFEQYLQDRGLPLEYKSYYIQDEGSAKGFVFGRGQQRYDGSCMSTNFMFGYTTRMSTITLSGNDIHKEDHDVKVTAAPSKFTRITQVHRNIDAGSLRECTNEMTGSEMERENVKSCLHDSAAEKGYEFRADAGEQWNVFKIYNETLNDGGRLVDRDPAAVENAARAFPDDDVDFT